MSSRDRFFSTLFTFGYVVAILWTIFYAVQSAWILDDGMLFGWPSDTPTTFWQRAGIAQQCISSTLLGVVMTVVFVGGVERIRRRYRVQPTGFPVRRHP